MTVAIEWKKRSKHYEKAGIKYRRLESSDGVYIVGSCFSDLSGDGERHHALVKVGRHERIISTHRSEQAAMDACERHARTH